MGAIARALGRAKTTISRELQRNAMCVARSMWSMRPLRTRKPTAQFLEEEAQHRHRGVDGWWLNAGRRPVQLERAQIFGSRCVGGPA
jgi:hypothetical protein